MADAAVGFLLENLKQLLLYNAKLIGDAKGEVEGLYDDLIVFKAFLRASTEKSSNDDILQAVVSNVRRVVDKAEDAIEKFVVEKAIFKARSVFRKAVRAFGYSVTVKNLAEEIIPIRGEVSTIYKRNKFAFKALQRQGTGAPKKQSPAVEVDNVVGFDEEAETIIQHLTREDQDLDVITITGMTGLGKTTLAKKIYDHPTIENKSFTRAWVYVSQNYNRREIFLSILSIFNETTQYMHKSDDVLIEELCKVFEKRKYLIVMDDLWTIEAWDDLKRAFPNKKNGSRILITSQDENVATHASRNNSLHNLNPLDQDKSWELLEKKVFGEEKCNSSELQNYGRRIVGECRGVPLAIVVIAGILLNNRKSSNWWKKVAENVDSFIVTDERRFMNVIAFSHNHLPYHLKSCFLYLGVFPEDHEIPVQKLIRLWIAEGFIEQIGELTLEDVAEAYVEDLVNRNLFTAVQRRCNGQIKTCRIHDMLYDFCKTEAGKQNFYQEIKRPTQTTPENYRRVCVNSGVKEYMSSNPYGEHVRSFLCFAPDETPLQREHISVIPKAFKLLRVLDIISITFDMFPTDILQLVLLRYIAISCNISTLPSSISRLWTMQTLVLRTKSHTLELTKGIWKMSQLRHLSTNASARLPSPPSDNRKVLENVQSLTTISPESCNGNVFARTPNIKKLGVRGNLVSNFANLVEIAGKLKYLTNLKLFNDVSARSPSDVKIERLPPAFNFLTKLKKLTVSNTFLDWEQLHILGNLETLEVLKLKDNAFRGRLWKPKDGGFSSLQLLHIEKTDLVTWEASERHFPSLKHLVLQQCEKLEGVPLGLADVPSFQVLALYHTPRAVASARRIQQKKMTMEGQGAQPTSGFKLSTYP